MDKSKNKKKVAFYGFQFAHHGKHTAYVALKEVMKTNNIKVVTAKRPKIFHERGFRRLLKTWMKIQEFRLYRFYKNSINNIIHYFFPENSLFLGPKWKGNNKLIITCHQPVTDSYFERIEKTNPYFIEGIKNANVIILMASKDITSLQELCTSGRCNKYPTRCRRFFFFKRKIKL